MTFPNVCLLVELVMTLGPSNSVVESIFSHLTAMLSDRRLSLNHSTMEDLLLLKCNKSFFTQVTFEELIQSSVDVFLQKRRKRKLHQDEKVETPNGNGAKKRKPEEEEEEEDGDQSEEVMIPFSDDEDDVDEDGEVEDEAAMSMDVDEDLFSRLL